MADDLSALSDEDLHAAWYEACDGLAVAKERQRAVTAALHDRKIEPGDPPEKPEDRPTEAPEVVLRAMVEQAGFSPADAAAALQSMPATTQVAQPAGVDAPPEG
jgi:hypothetical protein